MLEAIRKRKAKKAAVMITSDKCYENRHSTTGHRESDCLGGDDPYSSSKACAELAILAYRRSFFANEADPARKVAVSSARAGNVIGGGDWSEDRLIPDLFRALSQKQILRVRNPVAIRPWQHVLEPVAGYLMLAERMVMHGEDFASAWNFGPDDSDARNVESVVRLALQRWNSGGRWEIDGNRHPAESQFLKLDSTKARLKIGWVPRWHLEAAINYTVDWYKAFNNGEDMRDLTYRQIDAYAKSGESA